VVSASRIRISWTARISNENVRRRILTSHRSHTSSSITLYVLIHPWTTVALLPRSLTANWADLVTPGSEPRWVWSRTAQHRSGTAYHRAQNRQNGYFRYTGQATRLWWWCLITSKLQHKTACLQCAPLMQIINLLNFCLDVVLYLHERKPTTPAIDQVFVTLDLNMRPMTLTHSVRKNWVKSE